MSGGDGDRRVVDGRFALEARLGGGGMGLVWRARDLVLDRAVALKEVRPADPGLAEFDPAAAAMLRARVLREARALARVEHPNVVTIHHVVDGGGDTYPWLVMELVTGGSLQDRLARGPMEPVEAALLGREVLAALRAAHEAGIQHRDVKPANVLLRPDGRPVLTDFGIAAVRESTALTATGSVIGTPDYMAPERISGGDGGPGADLWSLAMMLYVAVEGHHPLRRATTLATLAAVLNEPLPPPHRAGPLTPVLNALLVKDPEARPGPAELDAMLAAVAEGRPVPSPGPAAETSYHLAAPAAPHSAPGPYPPAPGPYTPGVPMGHPTAAPGRSTGPTAPQSGGFGPPAAWGTNPYSSPPGAAVPAARPERGRSSRRWTIAAAVLGVALTSVLIWQLVPRGTSTERNDINAGDPPAKTYSPDPGGSGTPGKSTGKDTGTGSDRTGGTGSTPATDTDTDTDADTDSGSEPGNLLTPAGVRHAVKELKAETGMDRVGSFSVYPQYVYAQVMVKGSDKKYDTYTYRVGKGVDKGIISGTLPSVWKPVSIDVFDWDALPALISRGEKELNVSEPTSRYLLIRQPNTAFGTPAGMAFYLSDKYNSSGYIEADTKGKVTKVNPAEN
jgi:eukaryotic-like serine/threonine-protein kinase